TSVPKRSSSLFQSRSYNATFTFGRTCLWSSAATSWTRIITFILPSKRRLNFTRKQHAQPNHIPPHQRRIRRVSPELRIPLAHERVINAKSFEPPHPPLIM